MVDIATNADAKALMREICENETAMVPQICRGRKYLGVGIIIRVQSDLVYPNNLVPIKMCSHCETCGLLKHCKWKMIEANIKQCVRIVMHTDLKSTD